jgi:hypothetical protein
MGDESQKGSQLSPVAQICPPSHWMSDMKRLAQELRISELSNDFQQLNQQSFRIVKCEYI